LRVGGMDGTYSRVRVQSPRVLVSSAVAQTGWGGKRELAITIDNETARRVALVLIVESSGKELERIQVDPMQGEDTRAHVTIHVPIQRSGLPQRSGDKRSPIVVLRGAAGEMLEVIPLVSKAP
jgi:hypothetical protein